MTKIAQRQHLIVVAGIPGFWATRTGGEVTVAHTKTRDGGSLTPDILQGPAEVADITVSRSYDSTRDDAVIARLQSMLQNGTVWNTTITSTPTDGDFVPNGPPRTWEVFLSKVMAPDADAESNNASKVELTFTARSVK